ncbi:MAG: c-type cytochrome [Cyclobacteriaceae bacterium]|nr:c-type cytochrome [Cyclobacteriaceae bacterium]
MTRKSLTARILKTFAFTALLTVTFMTAFSQEIPTDEANISEGKTLFNANCKTCHSVQNKLVGPALKDVYDRAPSVEWIISFVKNSQKVIKGGDEYAVALYKEYNNTEMTPFDSFSDEEILDILAYIKNETDNPEVVAEAVSETSEDAQADSAIPSTYLNAIVIGLIIVLALIFVVLVLITTVLTKYVNNKDLDKEDKEFVNQSFSIGATLSSKPFIFLVVFLFSAIMFKVVINGLFSIGIQKNYQPTQPIAFSHQIHAGQYEIDCNYCHTGVMKSKNANIPSPNICMNCHSSITKGTNTGETEISKIYDAIENNKPIEWVRIHNLPDLSYFNHSQHVNVGGVECQTCHGPIEEMDVVKQHSMLTMGWCVDCHRNTELNTKDNKYYDKLVELHKEDSDKALTVEDNGGLECAKCHY